ncbi:8234_t:CDS:2 [Entrophospora sp. SA101]|nr:8918_t:CDS:2 [Entrophospora sp. SA101]CAJ0892544.1 8234_t:CDS:2 [Entrophospora sp. SA101]
MARPAQKPRIKKSCTGCGDTFTTYQQNNYDYCRNCAINGNRYAKNQCPECGDSSGVIKFKAQIMEQHYQQKHALKPKEVKRAKTGAISKTETNTFQKYKYFTEQQALNILKPLLNEHKLTLTFTIGSNSDPAKAKGCAETYAIKYFLTKFFLIPTTDELDPDLFKLPEHLIRLAKERQETPEQIQQRHQEKDKKYEAELKAKYGAD